MTPLPASTSILWLRRIQRVASSIASWTAASLSGVCMGLIDDRRFADFDTYPFDESQGVDSLPETTAGLEQWERAAIETHFASRRNVLLLAAGGGRVLFGLRELGHDVFGVEYGSTLCGATNDRLHDLHCNETIVTPQRWNIPQEREFDAAFVARHYLSHIRGRSNRVAFLRNLRGVLSSQAPLIVSYYVRTPQARSFRAQAMLANFLRVCRRSKDPRIDVGDHIDPDSPLLHHHYTDEELSDELREAGFEVIEQDADWFGWAVARAVESSEPST